jgi:hypothetical protein
MAIVHFLRSANSGQLISPENPIHQLYLRSVEHSFSRIARKAYEARTLPPPSNAANTDENSYLNHFPLNAFELKNRSSSGSITRSIPAPHKYRNCREKTSQLSRLGHRANIDRRSANACVHPDNRYLFSVLEESHVP